MEEVGERDRKSWMLGEKNISTEKTKRKKTDSLLHLSSSVKLKVGSLDCWVNKGCLCHLGSLASVTSATGCKTSRNFGLERKENLSLLSTSSPSPKPFSFDLIATERRPLPPPTFWWLTFFLPSLFSGRDAFWRKKNKKREKNFFSFSLSSSSPEIEFYLYGIVHFRT